MADEAGVALLRSPLPDHQVLDNLQYFASLFLSEQTTLHGVYMELFTMGVLITGSAGSGKSELALELLSRGHRLVADDAAERPAEATDADTAAPTDARGWARVSSVPDARPSGLE